MLVRVRSVRRPLSQLSTALFFVLVDLSRGDMGSRYVRMYVLCTRTMYYMYIQVVRVVYM